MPVNDTESCAHREDDIVPFGKVLGVTDNGVPVFSNGERSFASRQLSVAPSVRRFGIPHSTFTTGMYDTLGFKWHSVEFVRRYLAMTKGLWLSFVPTAEDVWHLKDLVTSIPDGNSVTVTRHVNGDTTTLPSVGDIMVWGRSSSIPGGHVGIVTYISDNWVQLADQNYRFNRWPSGKNYSRQIERKIRDDNIVEYHDEESLLGWIKVEAPPYDFSRGDLPDRYRHILSSGHIVRYHLKREVKLPWTNPTERCDFFLKRSLTIDGNMGEGACAPDNDVPNGYYLVDYDMWCRFRFAANTLHEVAMEATRRILTDPDSEHILVHYFGVPRELHQQLRRSFDTIPPMGGRFDFGYNGKDIIMLEYNCDSSAAMLECGDTQDKMARYYGINSGISTGSFLFSKMVNYFKCLLQNDFVCPPHKVIHFMIDDNDEERYTALYAMNAAEEAGFRTKLCVKLTDFRFESSATDGECLIVSRDHPVIVDLEDEKVLLVWKTWAWDTILHQYSEQQSQESTELNQKPSLSDILLNDNIRVLEPLWKTLTGSKAILPFMYSLAPNHPNMVPASFQRTREIISGPYLSKPINGRAGQNIIMYDPEEDKDTVAAAPQTVEAPVLCRSLSLPLFEDVPASTFGTPVDEENENSTGRFFASSVIYQSRVFLKKYEQKYFPIFCGWTIGGEFGGVVVREDTSKITKLASLVVPARVLREHVPLPSAQNSDESCKVMPRCIECGFDIARIVHPETEMVEKCAACGRCCDKYYEFAHVQKWIDVVILERRAWIHVVFNQKNILSSLLLAALISCLVEAYVVRTTSVYALLQHNSVYLEKSIIENSSMLESLQIVRNLRSDMAPLMMYWSTWPALFLYACMEYLLCLVVAIWIGVRLQRGGDARQDDAMMITWAKSVSLAQTAKLGYLLFLVWRIPIPLVVVVDFVFLLWTIRGFSITTNHSNRLVAFIAVSCCLFTRVIFRQITGWSPQLIF